MHLQLITLFLIVSVTKLGAPHSQNGGSQISRVNTDGELISSPSTSQIGGAQEVNLGNETSTSEKNIDYQIGGSFNPESFVDKIANVVTKRLVQFHHPIPNWKFYDRAEPLDVSLPITTTVNQSSQFAVPIKENDLSDKFDEEAVLRKIPKKYKLQAKVLLDVFNARSDVATFDVNQVVYLNGESLPNSNITQFLLQLFNVKSSPNRIKKLRSQGFDDFVAQLEIMGLTHLFPYKNTVRSIKSESKKLNHPNESDMPTSSGASDEWWLLV